MSLPERPLSGQSASSTSEDDEALIRRAFDTTFFDVDFQAEDKETEEEDFFEKAFDTIRLEICRDCEAGRACQDALTHTARGAYNSKPPLLTLPTSIRERIYHYLSQEQSVRLEGRPLVRYAKRGLSTDLLLINKQTSTELEAYTIANNIFNIVAGHHIVQGTALTPLHEIGGLLPPATQYITQLNIVLEVDLDLLFQPAYQNSELTALEDETIFGSIASLTEMIQNAHFPNLKRISLSIYEIIPPSKRIHTTCNINEREVQNRYAEIIRPLLHLQVPEGLWVNDIDIVYGDGYTKEGADPGKWERASDYILLLQSVLCTEGVPFQSQQDPVQSHLSLAFPLCSPSLPLTSEGDQIRDLTATKLFSSMTPRNPLAFSSANYGAEQPLFEYLLPSTFSPPPMPLTSSPQAQSPARPPRLLKLKSPSTPALKSANSLKRYWNEGTSALVRRPTKGAMAELPPLPKSHPTSVPGEASGLSRAKSASDTSSPPLRKTPLASEKAKNPKQESESGPQLGKWFTEGANYTLDTFANVSWLDKDKGGKGEKGRWTLG